MIVAIASSSKFYEAAKQVNEKLIADGARVFTPSFVHDETMVTVSADKKAELTHRFLKNLKQSDVVYVVATGGYVGLSVAVEVGFAAALGLPIIFSEEPAEDAFKALSAGTLDMGAVSVQKLASYIDA
ncbi:MAG TPA: hypothetical protein VLF21_00095 [Candidatus Saccharimonadales bacterium]|nr:hypothetical protein [Candidatus Saccharimonadales bacterium]